MLNLCTSDKLITSFEFHEAKSQRKLTSGQRKSQNTPLNSQNVIKLQKKTELILSNKST